MPFLLDFISLVVSLFIRFSLFSSSPSPPLASSLSGRRFVRAAAAQ